MHGVPRGDALREQRRGIRRAHALGDREHVVQRDGDVIGVAAAVLGEGDHEAAGLRPVGRTVHDPAGHLEPGREVQRLVAPVLAAADHRVGEVHPDRVDGHEHVPLAARGHRRLGPAHDARRAEPVQRDDAAGGHTAPASQAPTRAQLADLPGASGGRRSSVGGTMDVTSLHNRRAVERWERVSVGDMFERLTWSYPDQEAIVARRGAFADPALQRVTYRAGRRARQPGGRRGCSRTGSSASTGCSCSARTRSRPT